MQKLSFFDKDIMEMVAKFFTRLVEVKFDRFQLRPISPKFPQTLAAQVTPYVQQTSARVRVYMCMRKMEKAMAKRTPDALPIQ